MMSPGGLRLTLVAMVLLVQLVTVIVVVTGMRGDTQRQFAVNAETELGLLADTVADRAQLYLEPAEHAIRVGQKLIADGFIDATDDAALLKFFVAQMETYDWVRGIHIGRADGSSVIVERNGNGLRSIISGGDHEVREPLVRQQYADRNRQRTWRDPEGEYDPRLRPWYRVARTNTDMIWTGVYPFSSSRSPGISAALAITDSTGTDAGVLSVDVDIRALSAHISRIPNATNGSAVILDAQRNAVAYSEFEHLRELLEHTRMPSFERVAGRPLRGLLSVIDELENPAEQLPGGFASVVVDGVEHLGLVRSIALADGKVDWLLLVQAPADEYSGGLRNLIMARLRTLIATILLPGLLAVVAIIRLTAPVYRLHHNATTDQLTGALTRHEFERRLTAELRTRRDLERGSRLVLMALDIDDFKSVNDNFGHGAGDAVLRTVVARLKRRIRDNDLVGRIGGDELMVALRVEAACDEIELVSRLRRAAVEQAVKTPAGRHLIGVTAGIAVQMPGETVEQLLERADHALVTGKARRKNRCYVARIRDEAQQPRAVDRTCATEEGTACSLPMGAERPRPIACEETADEVA